jgi:hypothetical protein
MVAELREQVARHTISRLASRVSDCVAKELVRQWRAGQCTQAPRIHQGITGSILNFKPIPITKGAQRDKDIDKMAGNIVKTYLAARPSEHRASETFYSRDAHGTARALAAGIDPDSNMGRLLRSMPSPGGRQNEWPVTEHRVGAAR